VPSGAAAVVTVASGGFGHDAVIWAGTLLSTPLLERFVDLLGEDIRERVTRRWADAHGATLSVCLEKRFFPALSTHLNTQLETWKRTIDTVERAVGLFPR
jgi:hypothetical protein